MPSKKKNFFAPTEVHFEAQNWCFKNGIKAWMEPVGKKYITVLDYQGNFKRGSVVADNAEDASMIIWNLYKKIHENQK